VTPRPSSRVEKAKQRLIKLLANEPGFVGAGVSTDQSGQEEIVVLVTDAKSPLMSKVPGEWEGIPVRTEVGGTPKKF
jgi:hypothetical protein